MNPVSLSASGRSLSRRQGVKQLRAQSQVPAVIYGSRTEPQSLQLTEKEIEDTISHAASEHILVDLEVKGDDSRKCLALIQDVQHHPVTGKILHVDLREVAEDESVVITAPIEPMGEPVGVKVSGGILEHVLFQTKIKGMPRDLPEVISVDVSPLDAGDTIHLGEIPLPENVISVGNPKLPVFSIGATRASRAAENKAAADGKG
jgi:large subunit ribosomal protein L25